MTNASKPTALADINDPDPTQGEQAAEQVKETANGVKQAVSKAAKNAKSAASAKADQIKGAAATEAGEVADRVRKAGSAFGADSLAHDATNRIADNLGQVAQSMRDADFGKIGADVSDFARRQPLVFFGAAAVLGFAAARMLKASERADGSHVAAPTPTPEAQSTTWGHS